MLRFRHRLKKLKKIKMLRRQRARDRFFYSENRITNMKNVKVVVLTGAGISAESGIQTFRSECAFTLLFIKGITVVNTLMHKNLFGRL